jgi:hypothetical protein
VRERALSWLLLLAAIVAAVVVTRRGSDAVVWAARVDPILAIPAGPALLVTADVGALAQASASDLFDVGTEQLLGVRATCGFEPLLAVRQVAFAMPSTATGDADSDFALIATTSLAVSEVIHCAESVIRKRGGRPIRAQIGAFSTLRDAQHPLGEVGVRQDGLMVLSGGPYFRAALDAAAGIVQRDEPARIRDELHAQLRRSLGPGQLKLSLLPGSDFILPGVRATGLGLNVVGHDVELGAIVGCDSAAACGQTKDLLERAARDLAQTSAAPALQALVVDQKERELRASARMPRHELERLLRELFASSQVEK